MSPVPSASFTPTVMVLGLLLSACTRGTWWYQDNSAVADEFDLLDHFSSSPTYSDDDILAVMDSCGIQRVYGSYGTLPIDEPAAIDDWNSFLHANLRASHLLLGDVSHLDDPSPLLSQIDQRLVEFNDAASANGRFDAVHLDIEPQQLDVCKTTSPDQDPKACYYAVLDLLDVVQQVRAKLDSDAPDVKLYVDIFHDFDDLGPGARVAWAPTYAVAETRRDDWFADLSAAVDGVTVMSYGSDDYLTTAYKAAWEWANMSTEVRIGTRTEDYGGDLSAMDAAATDLELSTTEAFLVDLHDFNEIFAGGGCP